VDPEGKSSLLARWSSEAQIEEGRLIEEGVRRRRGVGWTLKRKDEALEEQKRVFVYTKVGRGQADVIRGQTGSAGTQDVID